MKDKMIKYKDIFDGQDDIPEILHRWSSDSDPSITQDIVTLFQMREIFTERDNFVEVQENKLDVLEEQLNYSYDKFGNRDDAVSKQRRSKNVVENIKWKEEICVLKEQEKINILMHITQKGLIVDKINFLDEEDIPVTCMSVAIWSVDMWNDDDEGPCVFIYPEFVLNATWNLEPPEDDDLSWEIDVDQIREIIVDNTKYTFLL